MKSHEQGSRSGEDIESVHQMRVAIRRMRSLFNLIGAHYRRKTVAEFERGLREIARALGRHPRSRCVDFGFARFPGGASRRSRKTALASGDRQAG